MSIIRKSSDGQVQVLDGTFIFQSSFANKRKKVRGNQHKKLIDELNRRGYFANGKKRTDLFEDLGFPSLGTLGALDNPESFIPRMAQLAEMAMACLENKNQKAIEYYENPETQQRIPLGVLIGATLLWPYEEVLALIP